MGYEIYLEVFKLAITCVIAKSNQIKPREIFSCPVVICTV